jgi:hypothetical protein
MSWIIDVDHEADEDAKAPSNANAVGMMGPRGYEGDGSELKHKFQMYDDDDNLYYEGRSDEVDFGPLDDFGMPNAGCTYIKYKNENGVWEVI